MAASSLQDDEAMVADQSQMQAEAALLHGQYSQAFAHYLLLIQLQPNRKPDVKDQISLSLRKLGEELVKAGQVKELFAAYQEACQYFPECETILNDMGTQLFRLGYLDEAACCFRRALKIDPDFLAARNNLENMACHLIERWHFRMLNDRRRNHCFQSAIHAAIRDGYDKVLDVGAGTGLLSLYAVEGGAQSVHACEMSKTMFELAADVVATNQMSDRITLVHKKSTELTVPDDLPERVSLLVTETFDAGLLGEHILSTLQHAWKYLLKDKVCRVIPERARVYACALECESIRKQNRLLYPGVQHIELSDVELLCNTGTKTSHSLSHGLYQGLSHGSDEEEEDHEPYTTERLHSIRGGFKFLSEPTVVAHFNFDNAQCVEEYAAGFCHELEMLITVTGRVDAIVTWFDLQLDKEHSLNSAPGMHSCWEQCIYPVLPQHLLQKDANENLLVRHGDLLNVTCECRNNALHFRCNCIARSSQVSTTRSPQSSSSSLHNPSTSSLHNPATTSSSSSLRNTNSSSILHGHYSSQSAHNVSAFSSFAVTSSLHRNNHTSHNPSSSGSMGVLLGARTQPRPGSGIDYWSLSASPPATLTYGGVYNASSLLGYNSNLPSGGALGTGSSSSSSLLGSRSSESRTVNDMWSFSSSPPLPSIIPNVTSISTKRSGGNNVIAIQQQQQQQHHRNPSHQQDSTTTTHHQMQRPSSSVSNNNSATMLSRQQQQQHDGEAFSMYSSADPMMSSTAESLSQNSGAEEEGEGRGENGAAGGGGGGGDNRERQKDRRMDGLESRENLGRTGSGDGYPVPSQLGRPRISSNPCMEYSAAYDVDFPPLLKPSCSATNLGGSGGGGGGYDDPSIPTFLSPSSSSSKLVSSPQNNKLSFFLERAEIAFLNDLDYNRALCKALTTIRDSLFRSSSSESRISEFRVVDITHLTSMMPLQAVKIGAQEVCIVLPSPEVSESRAGGTSSQEIVCYLATVNGIDPQRVTFCHQGVEEMETEADWGVLVATDIVESCGCLRQQVLDDIALARALCLRPTDGVVLPHSVSVHGMLIESTALHQDSAVVGDDSTGGFLIAGLINDFQVTTHVDIELSTLEYKKLSEPFELFTFDFNATPRDKVPAYLDLHTQVRIKAVESGQVTAVVYWFDLELAENVRVCTLNQNLHWKQAAVMQKIHMTVSSGSDVTIKAACRNSCIGIDVTVP